MLKPYVHLMRRPGASAFFAAGILGRMPISMIGLGIVILIAQEKRLLRPGRRGLRRRRDRRRADRPDPGPAGRPVRPADGCCSSARCSARSALAGLLVAVRADAATWVLYLLSFVAGGTRPQVGSFVRARWTHLLGRGRALQTAFALEAVGDEVVFIVGPVLVTVARHPGQPVRRTGRRRRLGLAGGIWLALLRASDPPGRGQVRRCRAGAAALALDAAAQPDRSRASARRWAAPRWSRSRSPPRRARPDCPASYWPSGRSAACWPGSGTARCTGARRSNAGC